MVEREYPATIIPEQSVRGGPSLDFALHRHGHRYFQEATYFSLVGAFVLFAIAIA
ncbi:MAG: hypothetical protein JWM11_7642, partial [Planctomycetaceae bacterium]|nr:hypothetical protein [Planctomycetaceae bacterium]